MVFWVSVGTLGKSGLTHIAVVILVIILVLGAGGGGDLLVTALVIAVAVTVIINVARAWVIAATASDKCHGKRKYKSKYKYFPELHFVSPIMKSAYKSCFFGIRIPSYAFSIYCNILICFLQEIKALLTARNFTFVGMYKNNVSLLCNITFLNILK